MPEIELADAHRATHQGLQVRSRAEVLAHDRIARKCLSTSREPLTDEEKKERWIRLIDASKDAAGLQDLSQVVSRFQVLIREMFEAWLSEVNGHEPSVPAYAIVYSQFLPLICDLYDRICINLPGRDADRICQRMRNLGYRIADLLGITGPAIGGGTNVEIKAVLHQIGEVESKLTSVASNSRKAGEFRQKQMTLYEALDHLTIREYEIRRAGWRARMRLQVDSIGDEANLLTQTLTLLKDEFEERVQGQGGGDNMGPMSFVPSEKEAELRSPA